MFCPITHALFRRPVVAADGFSYELKAIQTHMNIKNTSPATNEPLSNMNLVVNYSLRNLIQGFVSKAQSTHGKKKMKTTHSHSPTPV